MNSYKIAKSTHCMQRLIEVDLRIYCNRRIGMCTHVKNAVKRWFSNIIEIGSIKPHGTAPDMCVSGMTLIRASMKGKFQRNLKHMDVGGGIKKVIVVSEDIV